MSDNTSSTFQSIFGAPKSASELFNAGVSNPGYVPNSTDFSSNAARESFLSGQQSSSQKSGS